MGLAFHSQKVLFKCSEQKSNFIPFFSPVPVWLRLQLARGSPHCPHSMSVWSPHLAQDYRSLCLFLGDKLDIQTQHYKLCNFKLNIGSGLRVDFISHIFPVSHLSTPPQCAGSPAPSSLSVVLTSVLVHWWH